ncbi:hypothetical protein DFJ77DRAFT_457825 [Powellomyces hirtus]|nr:hypothetical protein DFJ77DRAFT_457825 [Powellomyces hirtus]
MASPGNTSVPSTYPTPSLIASSDHLRELVARCESRHDQPQGPALVRRAHAALDDVDSSTRALNDLANNANRTVDDRLVRALKSSLRDAVGRADAAVKKEWEKVVNVLMDEVGFVFEADNADDPSIDGDEAAAKCRQSLQRVVASSDLVGELDTFVSEFIERRFRTYSRDLYFAMLDSANSATEHSLETRLQRIAKSLDATIGNEQPLPPRPQPVPAQRPPAQAFVAPNEVPTPAPRPQMEQRSPSQSSVAHPALPAPAPRPQQEGSGPGSRPPSEALPPPPRPATKPRPKSVATSQALSQPASSRAPPPIDRSPVAKSRVSTDGGPDELDAGETETQGRPVGLAADLNRMLSGPPPKFSRPSPRDEEDDAGEDSLPPRPPARIGMVDDPAEDEVHDVRHDYPTVSTHDHHEHPQPPSTPPIPNREPSLSDASLHATPVASPAVSSSGKEKEKDKEKEKKGQKSPKMGIRGMLSHLTKSRPKKAKKDSKADEDEEDEEDQIPEPAPVELPPPAHEQAAAAAVVPPRPAPRPPVQAHMEDDESDHSHRGHAKDLSSSSAQSAPRPTHSRPGSVADASFIHHPEQGSDDGASDVAPPPTVPAKPRKQQNAAMSALASVMRGRPQGDDAVTDGDDSSSIASRNRTSMYSDAGSTRPMSMHSEAGDRMNPRPESVHYPSAMSNQSTPTATPPRPARPASIAFSDAPSRRSTYDEHQLGSPPIGTVEPPLPAPKRPPKPVQSPLSQSPTKQKSGSGEEGPPAASLGNAAPAIPPKPANSRKSVLLEDTPVAGSAHSAPIPRPRPGSMARPPSQFSTTSERRQSAHSTADSLQFPSEVMQAEEQPEVPEESPKPRRIPGVFATNHGALGALAAAVNGRAGLSRSMSQEGYEEQASAQRDSPPQEEEHAPTRVPMPSRPNAGQQETESHYHEASVSSPPMVRRGPPNSGSNPDLFNNASLNFKRKEASTSGDDAAIEKGGLEWLNKHLASQNIQVDNLFGGSLGNGLNLIYALEDATGESAGRYNKRAMLPVHRLDNLAVALNFLSKKGISTSFCSPQDIMDGDRGKILTLFNYILKTFPQ